jgi:HD-GYP domain-containing protein (c-di-GMP phosphodiesterase class II)
LSTPPDSRLDQPAIGTAVASLPLREELGTVSWYQREVAGGEALPATEAQAVAYSLHLSLDRLGQQPVPLLPLPDMSEYVAVHAINVALLSMALAQYLDLPYADVRDIGIAGLLHDLGMALVPVDLLSKPDQLSTEERDLIKQHPVTGATLIVQSEPSLGLAAVVAYEHHLRPDGSGYPQLRYPRKAHYATRLVQLCDVYHALSSPRPFRQPWPQEIILSFINSRAGVEFDPELARAFADMLKRGVAAPR